MDELTGKANLATPFLAAELRATLGLLMRRLREQVHPGDYTWSQKQVVTRLDREGPQSVSDLARAEGVRPQSMSATVAALEAAGFVTGEADAQDGRRTLFSLTASCRKMIRESRRAREDWLLQALRKKLSVSEQAELASALELLKRLADVP